MGTVYVAYSEGDRPSVADDRSAFMIEQLKAWDHRWEIRVPVAVLNRLVARPLAHGSHDVAMPACPPNTALLADSFLSDPFARKLDAMPPTLPDRMMSAAKFPRRQFPSRNSAGIVASE